MKQQATSSIRRAVGSPMIQRPGRPTARSHRLGRWLVGDMTYDPGLRVVANGYALQEASPRAPCLELMNFSFQATGGARSPYVFNTTGMLYGPSQTPDHLSAQQLCVRWACLQMACINNRITFRLKEISTYPPADLQLIYITDRVTGRICRASLLQLQEK